LNNFSNNHEEYKKVKRSREIAQEEAGEKYNYWYQIQQSIESIGMFRSKKISLLALKLCQARAMEEYQRIKYAARKNNISPYDVFREVILFNVSTN
jgi:hypothetical protein